MMNDPMMSVPTACGTVSPRERTEEAPVKPPMLMPVSAKKKRGQVEGFPRLQDFEGTEGKQERKERRETWGREGRGREGREAVERERSSRWKEKRTTHS